MEKEKNVHVMISEEIRKAIEEELYSEIKEQYQVGMDEEGYCTYIVMLQGIKFETVMSDDELRRSIALVVDILEEMKLILNSGVSKKDLDELEAKYSTKFSEADESLISVFVWNEIATQKISAIVDELDLIRRVGGAYALLISNPLLRSAMYAVFYRMIDSGDEDDLYEKSAYFLLRAIMKMHSTEIKDN